jgi:hypothetical protein
MLFVCYGFTLASIRLFLRMGSLIRSAPAVGLFPHFFVPYPSVRPLLRSALGSFRFHVRHKFATRGSLTCAPFFIYLRACAHCFA